jgi:poly-gamma-glutamate synthesis protein (capsule biosynthesis protein)
VRLAFVGDIALGDHPKTVGFGFRSRYAAGIPAALAARLRPPGPAPDAFFGNLEFSLDGDGAPGGTLAQRQCRGLQQYADFLAAAGVTVLNVANNHSAQHGLDAFRTTVDACRARGITIVGAAADVAGAGGVRAGGRAVAVLGWSDRPRQYAAHAPPYNEFGDHAYDMIRAARRRADGVVASIHWGEEFVLVPADRERRIARAMIDAGAALVIGHHPHVLREIEPYGGGLIAYSLGNFVGDMTWNSDTRLGGCLLVDLQGSDVKSHHLAISRIGADYLPEYLSPHESAKAVRRMERRRRQQAHGSARRGYDAVAAAEHRRHIRATALMMVRNLHRYPRGVLLPMIRSAVASRLGHPAPGSA